MEPNPALERSSDVDFTADITMIDTGPGATEMTVVADSSFERFYREHRAPIARALTLTLRDRDLAVEATDEAMARAYQRWHHVQAMDNAPGWVYRVALNWSRSVIRRLTRPAPRWVTGDGVADAPSLQDPAIERALDQLSVDQRAVVVCRLLLAYSEAQTADLLGLRPGTVKSRLSRALDKLTPLLSPLHHDDQEIPS